MKLILKNFFILGMTSLAFMSSNVIARSEEETMTLPVISKPKALDEGTQRVLSQAQLDELLPWAKDSKVFLQDLLESASSLRIIDQVERMRSGIEDVVNESKNHKSELFMRYVLNRALVISKILEKEINNDSVGYLDIQRNVLKISIENAIRYYDLDFKEKKQNNKMPFIFFGNEYFNFLSELNKSVLDASAQYQIQRIALEWLQWDLYRDLNNKMFASQIAKINNSLRSFPEDKKINDFQSLNYIKQLKMIGYQLRLDEKIIEVRNNFTREENEIAKQNQDLQKTESRKNLGFEINDAVLYGLESPEVYTIVGKSKNGYLLESGNGNTLKNIKQSEIASITGCTFYGACVDEEVLAINHKNALSEIVALKENGDFVLKLIEGENNGRYVIGTSLTIGRMSGSMNGFFVGDRVIDLRKDLEAEVVAYTADGRIIISYVDDNSLSKPMDVKNFQKINN